jgi:carbonic anhydrase
MKRNLLIICLAVFAAVSCSEKTEQAAEQAATGQPAAEPAVASHEGSHWSYEGESGPASWGTLNPEWLPCGDGKSQSPIDIDQAGADDPATTASLQVTHAAHVADGVNNGHTIQINYSQGDVLTVDGQPFDLVQYHFHSPSEHTVKGQHHPMEMHLVHKSADNRLAVIGVFIAEGVHNAAFDPVWSSLPATKGAETHLENVMVDVNQLLPTSMESYRYDGSLTTPPCSEGVEWIVMTTPIQMSPEQINAFRSIISGNNRPTQPLNGRAVETDHVASGQ